LGLFVTGNLQWLIVLLINRIVSKNNAFLYLGCNRFLIHGAPPFIHEAQ